MILQIKDFINKNKYVIFFAAFLCLVVLAYQINLSQVGEVQNPLLKDENMQRDIPPDQRISLLSSFPDQNIEQMTYDNYQIVSFTFDKTVTPDDFTVSIRPPAAYKIVSLGGSKIGVYPTDTGWKANVIYDIVVSSPRLINPIQYKYSFKIPEKSGLEDINFAY